MVEDVVRALGYLCLGTRLRRLGEQLQAETQRVMDDAGVSFQAGQYPLLAAIDRLGPLSVGDLATALGITQPGATRAPALLVEAGYLEIVRVEGDGRLRLHALTDAGTALVAMSRADVWPRVEQAVAELCAPLSGSLLDQLAALETGLREVPLLQRVQTPKGRGR